MYDMVRMMQDGTTYASRRIQIDNLNMEGGEIRFWSVLTHVRTAGVGNRSMMMGDDDDWQRAAQGGLRRCLIRRFDARTHV